MIQDFYSFYSIKSYYKIMVLILCARQYVLLLLLFIQSSVALLLPGP